MPRGTKKGWHELTTGQRVAAMVMTSIQISLAVSAWYDLARRPAGEVNGPKKLWAVVIAVNYVGPIAYFVKGRHRS